VFVPAGKFGRAGSLQSKGNLAEAYDAYEKMGDYRDALDRMLELQAQVIASRSSEFMEFGGRQWLVLEERDGRALLLAKDVTEMMPYNESLVDTTWEDCTLRLYLNGAFYNSFQEADRARIARTNVVNSDNVENSAAVKAGGDTQDYIFLLSLAEAKLYFSTDAARSARQANGAAAYWWLRSPGMEPILASVVGSDGSIGFAGSGVDYGSRGVRPAMWVALAQD